MVAAAVIGSAVVGAGASAYGASQSAKASKQAAGIQADSANSDRALQEKIYNQNRSDAMPWLTAGGQGLSSLGDFLGTSGNTSAANYGQGVKPFSMSDFNADPGYQFNLQQGQRALDRTASSKGQFFSGAASKALQRYSQDYASNQFDTAYNRYNTNNTNTYNRLAGLSGVGQTASSQLQSAGNSYGTNAGNAITGAGNAQASGIVGAANAWNSGLSGVSSAASGGANNYALLSALGKV